MMPLTQPTQASDKPSNSLEMATFGAGCFWCVEAVFEELKGVSEVVSGYSGGNIDQPTYREVCSGLTGHAEVIHFKYDPQVISFEKLLEVFWMTHDPTTPNQQGADRGSQYRSVIFYHSQKQKELAEKWKAKLDAENIFPAPIVTEIAPFTSFFPAEKEHQNYYKNNAQAPYCNYVIVPKMKKFKALFEADLKP